MTFWRRWSGRSKWERELSEELRDHFEKQVAANVAGGIPADEARRQATLKFGAVEGVKEDCREQRSGFWLETLLADLRYALRMFRKNPGFAAIAILTLALGIGANTAIFSVVEGVMLAPLPYFQPDRLVMVWQYNRTLKHVISVSYPDFLDWQRDARSFQQMAAFGWQDRDLTGPGTPEHLNGKQASSGFLSTLGVNPILGREFSPEEDKHGGAPAVIISYRLWRSRFARSPQALGQSVTLDGVDYTVIGVLPSDFRLVGDDADVYTPLGQGDPVIFGDRTIHPILCIARLKPGVTVAQSDAEMGAVQEHLVQLYPAADRGLGANVKSLKQELVGDLSGTLLMLMGAVGIVLLIACANVANLLLARSAARTREFAIRSALGANRPRIVRQLITESMLLSLAGGILGVAVAKWAVRPLLTAVPGGLPRSENIGVNVSVLLFALGVSVAVGILFGLAPALKSWNADPQASLKEGGRGSTSVHHRAQSSLAIVQMALTLVLLVGAGLLFRTIRQLWEVNPGFDARHVIAFNVGLSPSARKTVSSTRIAYQQLIERIRNIPGVKAADLTVLFPLSEHQNIGPFWVGSQEPASIAEAPRALFYWTGPDYLRTMEIPLLQGRFFTEADATNTEPVILIDSVLARAYFPDRDPVGQAMTIPHWGPVLVIGVVGHVRHWGLDERDAYTQNQIYASLYQLPDDWAPIFYRGLTVVVNTTLDTATVMPAIKAAVYSASDDRTVYGVQALQEVLSESLSSQRFPMILLGVFAGLALLLASIGVYGVISYSVTQRTHEIGIRITLGAEKHTVFRMVIAQGLRLAFAGLAIGAVAALILARVLSSFSHLLYGVRAGDPLTFVAVSLMMTAVVVSACYIPARRAMRVDPMTALRHE
jgi:putative ABC transport system permease protein